MAKQLYYHKCDQASENQAYVHILIFEKYQFELFNAT